MKKRSALTEREPTKTELQLAEAIGMKNDNGYYLHWEEVLTGRPFSTIFTQPPYFSTSIGWIPILKLIAKEKFNIILEENYDPERVSKEFLKKLS